MTTTSNTVIVVGGPAGTGKTTIAELLAAHFQCPFIEGDALHPPQNIAKMSKGTPLTDDDRWDWLKEVAQVSARHCTDSTNKANIAIVSCSILKKVYREHIKKCSEESLSDKIQFKFVFLHTTLEHLFERVQNRPGHFMKSDMVSSQYSIMEIPCGEELIENGGEALPVDTTDKLPQQIYQETLSALKL
ncbi:uncharacterized protein AC631_02577 [Debaryomyces fabryi]|uniref:Gluconokinase n=1 Tax=Debaryomyces fabryi TaxID=58627 RepID=A0A0V1Q024_9ASCO|nr:uncharacterized protein AC631_02577 [Debaryomyces fabryi]KSA01637.1 hypothetical protein AC631_02577 [Debaryomyces fabryi]CUM45424.1 unnamed protein product [Debaryomyces fabryi]